MWAYRIPPLERDARPVVLRPSVMATLDALRRATAGESVWWLGSAEVRPDAVLIVDVCIPEQRVGAPVSSVVNQPGFDPAAHNIWGRIVPGSGPLQATHDDDALFEEMMEHLDTSLCVRLLMNDDSLDAAVGELAQDGVTYAYDVPVILGYDELSPTQHRAAMSAIQRCLKTSAGRPPMKRKAPDGSVHFKF